jgi:sulfate transport system permease protein
VRALLIGIALAVPDAVPVRAAGGGVLRGAAQGLGCLRGVHHRADAWSAIKLTLLAAAIAVPLNLVFGVAGLGHRQVRVPRQERAADPDRPAVLGLAGDLGPDLRAAVRPQGWFGPWLREHDIKILFAVPGIVLATIFVTFPFVARELIPLMQAQGSEEEEAALVLGASGWRPSGT